MPQREPLPAVPAQQFFDVDMRVGRVLECTEFPQARQPAYRLLVDFGPLGTRRSSARLVDNYAAQDLVGRLVIAAVNLPPRQIGPVRSEVLVLGVYQHGGSAVTLLRPDGDCEPGDQVG